MRLLLLVFKAVITDQISLVLGLVGHATTQTELIPISVIDLDKRAFGREELLEVFGLRNEQSQLVLVKLGYSSLLVAHDGLRIQLQLIVSMILGAK